MTTYPLTEEQAEMLTWVRWAYAGMSVLAVACLVSALWAGHPGEQTLWTSTTGVLAFPVLSLLSFRQLHHHRAALEELRRRHDRSVHRVRHVRHVRDSGSDRPQAPRSLTS